MNHTFKPQELRTRSRVEFYIGEEGCEWNETTVDWQDLKQLEEDPEWFNKYHRPIPITEERLKEAGFVFDGVKYTLHDFIHVINCSITKEPEWGVCFGSDSTILGISYYHQLQNIVFDLTGIEI